MTCPARLQMRHTRWPRGGDCDRSERSEFEAGVAVIRAGSGVLYRQLSFPSTPAADGVDERQEFVERLVRASRFRNGAVERFEFLATDRTVRVGPDGRRFVARGELVAQRGSRMRRWEATREATVLRREDILEPVNQEFEERLSIWYVAIVVLEQPRARARRTDEWTSDALMERSTASLG